MADAFDSSICDIFSATLECEVLDHRNFQTDASVHEPEAKSLPNRNEPLLMRTILIVSTVLILLAVAASWFVRPTIMTAGEWWDACSLTLILKKSEIATLSPDRRLAVRQCKRIAATVFVEEGYDGSNIGPKIGDSPEDQADLSALKRDCPVFSMPLGGVHFIAMRYWEKKGGPGNLASWRSAEWAVSKGFKNSSWKNCPQTRRRTGYYTRQVELDAVIEGWVRLANDP